MITYKNPAGLKYVKWQQEKQLWNERELRIKVVLPKFFLGIFRDTGCIKSLWPTQEDLTMKTYIQI